MNKNVPLSGGFGNKKAFARTSFESLDDTFKYIGQAGKVVTVRGDESGLTAQAEAIIDDHKVMVSGTDTTPGYLIDKLEALIEIYQGGLTLTNQAPAGDSTLKIGINAVHPTIGLDSEINAPRVNNDSLTPDHFMSYYKDGDPSIPGLRSLGTLTNQAAAGSHNHGTGTIGTLQKFSDIQGHIVDSMLKENGYGGVYVQPRTANDPMYELRDYLGNFKGSLVWDKGTGDIYISLTGVSPHPFKISSTGGISFPKLTANGYLVTGGGTGAVSVQTAQPTGDHKIMVSATDTTPRYLVDKLEALMESYQGGLTLTNQAPAGDSTLKIGINAVHPTIGIDGELNAPKVNSGSLSTSDLDPMWQDPAPYISGFRSLGTLSDQACAGNDSRLSNSRTPTAHDLAGALHNSDTITNLNLKLSDGDVLSTKSGEYNAFTDKTPLVEADIISLEDSAATFAKKKTTYRQLLGHDVVLGQEIIFTASQFSSRDALPLLIEDISIGAGAGMTIKTAKFPNDLTAQALLIIPVPHAYWNKGVIDLDVTGICLETPSDAAHNTVRIAAKAWALPAGPNMLFDPSGYDLYVENTFFCKNDQVRFPLFSLPINTPMDTFTVYNPTPALPVAPTDGAIYRASATANGWTDKHYYQWSARNALYIDKGTWGAGADQNFPSGPIRLYDNTAAAPAGPVHGDTWRALVTANGWTALHFYQYSGFSASWLDRGLTWGQLSHHGIIVVKFYRDQASEAAGTKYGFPIYCPGVNFEYWLSMVTPT